MSTIKKNHNKKEGIRVTVAMLGARRHYAVPAALEKAGLLQHFFTDAIATQGWPRILQLLNKQTLPKVLQRLAGRVPNGVPLNKITSYPTLGFEYSFRLSRAKTLDESLEIFTSTAKAFASLVKRDSFHNANTLYTFDRCGLELMTFAKANGINTIMDQTVAPFRTDQIILRREEKDYSLWGVGETATPAKEQLFTAREEAEWALADLILCPSDYVKEAIIQCGGPGERCKVLNYDSGEKNHITNERFFYNRQSGPLRVLTVGAVSLRKGSQYVMEAAKQLRGIATFRMVGPLLISPQARVELGQCVELTGQVPRINIAEHYEWADVFLLPSLNEGSAGVVYEAMTYGLPVICTPNTGSIIRHNYDGFIVPIRDATSIVNSLNTLVNNSNLLETMSQNAFKTGQNYNSGFYTTNLKKILTEHFFSN